MQRTLYPYDILFRPYPHNGQISYGNAPEESGSEFTPQKVATKILAFIDKAADEAQSKLSEKAKQEGVSYHHLKVSQKAQINAMLLTASDGVTVIMEMFDKATHQFKKHWQKPAPNAFVQFKDYQDKVLVEIAKGTYDTQLTPEQKKQIEENLEKNTKDLDQWYETPAFYLGILGLVGLIAIPQIVGMVRRTR